MRTEKYARHVFLITISLERCLDTLQTLKADTVKVATEH